MRISETKYKVDACSYRTSQKLMASGCAWHCRTTYVLWISQYPHTWGQLLPWIWQLTPCSCLCLCSCPKSFRWCTCPLEKDPNSSHCQHFLCLKISSLCKGLDQSNLSWIICRNFTSHNTGIKDYRNNDPDKNMSSLWEFKSKRSMNTNRLLDKKTFRELI
jgi:hypothetical protein